MAGSIAFLRQFESQVPSLDSQINNLSSHDQRSDEEEKQSDDDIHLNLSDELDEDMILSSMRL